MTHYEHHSLRGRNRGRDKQPKRKCRGYESLHNPSQAWPVRGLRHSFAFPNGPGDVRHNDQPTPIHASQSQQVHCLATYSQAEQGSAGRRCEGRSITPNRPRRASGTFCADDEALTAAVGIHHRASDSPYPELCVARDPESSLRAPITRPDNQMSCDGDVRRPSRPRGGVRGAEAPRADQLTAPPRLPRDVTPAIRHADSIAARRQPSS